MDYRILVAITIFSGIIFFIIKDLNITLSIKISIFIMISGFFSILIIVGVNGENMLDFLYFMSKFLIRDKVYVYRKIEE